MIKETGVKESFIAFGEYSNELNVFLIVIACLFGFIFLGGLVSHLVGSKKGNYSSKQDTE